VKEIQKFILTDEKSCSIVNAGKLDDYVLTELESILNENHVISKDKTRDVINSVLKSINGEKNDIQLKPKKKGGSGRKKGSKNKNNRSQFSFDILNQDKLQFHQNLTQQLLQQAQLFNNQSISAAPLYSQQNQQYKVNPVQQLFKLQQQQNNQQQNVLENANIQSGNKEDDINNFTIKKESVTN